MREAFIRKTGRFVVTLEDVRSANDMYTLAAVSHCRIRRPLAVVTVVAITGLSALIAVWWDVLFDGERLLLAIIGGSALCTASQFARLQLMSLELRDETFIYGSIREMRALKADIESALMERRRLARAVLALDPRNQNAIEPSARRAADESVECGDTAASGGRG